ncbi:zinc finger matrin-type protein [Gossypium australe]|uniref:Zinc finger matrin-type protein n=1 Tax=Gossypium australe TaxID=47621 RepID=A0A5B6UJH0_9ROSI|nr:zinc finger matrin-type protein [Gossypium australe]
MLSHLSHFPKSPAFSTSHSFFQLSQPTKRKGGRDTPHSSANVCGCNHPTMICLYLSQPYSASSFSLNPSLIPSSIPKFKPAFHCFPKTHKKKKKINRGICRAEFSPDAPLAAAIGACMLSSLLLPAADTGEEDGGSSIIDAGDTRFAAMGIISFIPYFNWLGEVGAGFLLGLILESGATPCILLYTWFLTSGITFTEYHIGMNIQIILSLKCLSCFSLRAAMMSNLGSNGGSAKSIEFNVSST